MKVKITDAEFEACYDIYELLKSKGVDVKKPYLWSRIPIFHETLIEQPPPEVNKLPPWVKKP